MAWRYAAPGGFQINRVKGWIRRLKLTSLSTPRLVALGILSFAIVAGLLWKVPEWQVPAGVDDPQVRAALENEFRRTAAQVALGLGLLGTLFVGWRRVRATEETVKVAQESVKIAQEQQLTERFTRAIDQLGNEASMAIRLGGIYALERIAKDSAKDHWQVMEVLTAYVREYARWEGEVDEHRVPVSEDPAEHRAPTDIQAILTVLGRREAKYDPPGERLDLISTDLRRSRLVGANLRSAFLLEVNLQIALAIGANLQGTGLNDANLQGALLTNANLQRANCDYANLQGAYLDDADLQGADLIRANLHGASLLRANLTGVRNLTQEQIDSAITDEHTVLPDYLLWEEPSS